MSEIQHGYFIQNRTCMSWSDSVIGTIFFLFSFVCIVFVVATRAWLALSSREESEVEEEDEQ